MPGRDRHGFVVVGAGPAGLTIARLLALRGHPVTVLTGLQRRSPSRLELLGPAARQTIAALGLEQVLGDRSIARPCLGIRRPGFTPEYEDFLAHPNGQGHVIDRARFDAVLREAAVRAGARMLPLQVVGLAEDKHALRVRSIKGPRSDFVTDAVVIDATGRSSVIARSMGERFIYRDRTIAELIEQSADGGGERSDVPSWLSYSETEAGWSYHLCGPDGHSQRWRVGRAQPAPAALSHRTDASACMLSGSAGPRWIAIGDAAAAFNPIASQGLFNALSTALVAAGLLLSKEGLTDATAQHWSASIAATFLRSESLRLVSSMNDPDGPDATVSSTHHGWTQGLTEQENRSAPSR